MINEVFLEKSSFQNLSNFSGFQKYFFRRAEKILGKNVYLEYFYRITVFPQKKINQNSVFETSENLNFPPKILGGLPGLTRGIFCCFITYLTDSQSREPRVQKSCSLFKESAIYSMHVIFYIL